MAKLLTSILIPAPRECVWRVLTDFEGYPKWNPYVRRIRGELRLGQTLEVTVSPPGGMARTFSPTVTCVQPETEFRWAWGMGSPWLFLGEHIFTLKTEASKQTRFIHHEDFTGCLTFLHRIFRYEVTRSGFEAMNVALQAQFAAPANER